MRHHPATAILALSALLFTAGCSAPAATSMPDSSASPSEAAAGQASSPAATPREEPVAAPFTARVQPSKSSPSAGETIRVTGINYTPNSELEVTILAAQGPPAQDEDGMYHAPEPIYIAGPVAVTADAQGRVDTEISIPVGVSHQSAHLGITSAQGFGEDSQGATVSITVGQPG